MSEIGGELRRLTGASPINVAFQFSSLASFRILIDVLSYFVGLPLPSEFLESPSHKANLVILQDVRDKMELTFAQIYGSAPPQGLPSDLTFGEGGGIQQFLPLGFPEGENDL